MQRATPVVPFRLQGSLIEIKSQKWHTNNMEPTYISPFRICMISFNFLHMLELTIYVNKGSMANPKCEDQNLSQ